MLCHLCHTFHTLLHMDDGNPHNETWQHHQPRLWAPFPTLRLIVQCLTSIIRTMHNHLSLWCFVIHWAVDGFSRTITFLKCADNNRATTILDLFCKAVSRFSLPNYVCLDHGRETVGILKCMILSHSNDYSCVLTGSSVHNERENVA